MFIKHVIQQSVRERIQRTAREKYASQATEVIINSKPEYSIQNNIFCAPRPAPDLHNSVRWHHVLSVAWIKSKVFPRYILENWNRMVAFLIVEAFRTRAYQKETIYI